MVESPNVSRRPKCYRPDPGRAINGVTEADVPKEGISVGPRAKREYVAQMRDRR